MDMQMLAVDSDTNQLDDLSRQCQYKVLLANGGHVIVKNGIEHDACDCLDNSVHFEELSNIRKHVIRKNLELKLQNKSNSHAYAHIRNEGENRTSPKVLDRKRKIEEKEVEGLDSFESSKIQKSPRLVWSVELHQKFVAAAIQLGIDKATPKKIIDLMNVEGLTRGNVAAHLQKYMYHLQRLMVMEVQQPNVRVALGDYGTYNIDSLKISEPISQANRNFGFPPGTQQSQSACHTIYTNVDGSSSTSIQSPSNENIISQGYQEKLLDVGVSRNIAYNSTFGETNAKTSENVVHIEDVTNPLSENLDKEDQAINERTIFPLINQENTSLHDSEMSSNEDYVLDQMESQNGFNSLDDYMGSMMKQEQEGTRRRAFFHVLANCVVKYSKTIHKSMLAILANYYLKRSQNKVLAKSDVPRKGKIETKRSNIPCFLIIVFILFMFTILKLFG